jgi:hypothetical protein
MALVFGKPSASIELMIETLELSIKFPIVSFGFLIFILPYNALDQRFLPAHAFGTGIHPLECFVRCALLSFFITSPLVSGQYVWKYESEHLWAAFVLVMKCKSEIRITGAR